MKKELKKWLDDHQMTVDVKYSKFDSMNWDRDGEKRNIYNVTISHKGAEIYTTEYGDSIVNSCKKDSKLYTKGEETVGVWVRDTKTNHTVFSYGVKVSHEQLKEVYEGALPDYELIDNDKLQEELDKDLALFVEKLAKQQHYMPKSEIKNRTQSLSRQYSFDKVVAMIQKNIAKKIDELLKQTDYIAEQKEDFEAPSIESVMYSMIPYEVGDFADFCAEFGYELKTADDIRHAQRIHKACKEQYEALFHLATWEEWEELREIVD